MSIDPAKIVAIGAAFVGAFFGGLIAEVRTVLHGRREQYRARRVILYHLLEMRFQLARNDVRAFLKALGDVLQEKLGVNASELMSNPVTAGLIRQFLASGMEVIATPAIGGAYAEAVDRLAPDDPIVAYTLRGRSSVLQIDHEVRAYYDRIRQVDEVAKDPAAQTMMPTMESATLETTRQSALADLAEDIRGVIPWWNLVLRRQVKRILRRQTEPSETVQEEWKQAMEDWLSKVMAGSGP